MNDLATTAGNAGKSSTVATPAARWRSLAGKAGRGLMTLLPGLAILAFWHAPPDQPAAFTVQKRERGRVEDNVRAEAHDEIRRARDGIGNSFRHRQTYHSESTSCQKQALPEP